MVWLRHALVIEYNDLSDADCIFLIAYYQCGQKFNLFEKFEKKSYPLAFYNNSKPLTPKSCQLTQAIIKIISK